MHHNALHHRGAGQLRGAGHIRGAWKRNVIYSAIIAPKVLYYHY